MREYLNAVDDVILYGTRKANRTGVDTISTFNINYDIDLREGFPLLTTKEVSWKNIVIENLWFLSGDTSVSFLQKHNCKFWDAWVQDDNTVPSAYGNFWRHFPNGRTGNPAFNDQIEWIVNELKNNPMSRRCVVSAWYPHNAQNSKLPPCHLLFVFNVQFDHDGNEMLCLHLTQRSADMALGVPYNIAGYALILELVSKLTNIPVGIFGHTLIDAHIYTDKEDGSMPEYDHIPGLRTQLSRTPRTLPNLEIKGIERLSDIADIIKSDMTTDEILEMFKLTNYNPYPKINFKVAV